MEKLVAFIEQARSHANANRPDTKPVAATGDAPTEQRDTALRAPTVSPPAQAPVVRQQIELNLGRPDDLFDESLFVEVGDTVTFYFASRPDELKTVRIIPDGERLDVEQGLLPEGTPLAQALLDTEQGGETTLSVPGKPPAKICVKKIIRGTRRLVAAE